MNTIWDNSDIDIEEEPTSPISFNCTTASKSMMNSSFRNKGSVKEQDREKLFDEINLELIKTKRGNLSCSKKNSEDWFDFKISPQLMDASSEISEKSSSSDFSRSSKISGDIKYLLGELVRNKKGRETTKSVESDDRLVTMNDVSPVN